MRPLLLFAFFSVSLFSQTAETAIFRAVLLPANEVPPVNSNNRGITDVIVSVVRDASGQVVSGTVDFLLHSSFAAANNLTGLDLRNGATGQTGAMAVTSGITPASPRAIASGADIVHIPAQVTPDNTAAVAGLRALLQDPTKFYINLPTTDQPNGMMRGQLQRAQMKVLMGIMSSDQVVPAPAIDKGDGVAQVVAIGTRDGNGNFTSGEVYLALSGTASDATAFNAFHIHSGPAGVAGAIAITGALPPGQQIDPSGAISISPIYTEIAIGTPAQLSAFSNLFGNSTVTYLDLHSTGNPNGILRGQLRQTDAMPFSLVLDSANEAVKPKVQTTAPVTITVYTLRHEDGSIAAATMLSDLDYRFPGPAQFLGLYVHDGVIGVNGPVSILLSAPFSTDSGFGNYFNWTPPIDNLAAVEDLVNNPSSHYVNLHTFTDPGGAARAQFGPLLTGVPTVGGVLAADLDRTATTVAPGGLVSIFGTRLVNVSTDLSGWVGTNVPVSLNGTRVTVGGKLAPLIYVGPGQINAQVPVDVAPGTQMVIVENNAKAGPGFAVNVARNAPAIFFSPVPAVLKNVNFSVVSASNPAHAGDVLLVYATGLGQTTPPMSTGVLAPTVGLLQTSPVGVTIGGKTATVVYSIASPQTSGLYQVAVTVPTGLTGSVPLVITQGTATSNTVNINVQ